MNRCIALGLCVLFLSGCSLQKLTANQTADALYSGQIALESEPDIQFAKDAMPGSLKTVETFLHSSPENKKFLEMLAKGYFSYAFAFIEWDLEVAQFGMADEEVVETLNRRAVIHYNRAREYGWRLLDNEAVKKAAEAGDEAALDAALAKLDEDDVPGIFWVGYAWGSAINLSQDDPDMVAQLGIVEKMLRRSMDLDDTYFFGGVHLFFGVFYASRPKMAGGDPEKAKYHFELAMKRYGNENLLVPYLGARFYATATQDAALFKSMLNRVVSANVDPYPQLRLNNEVARQRADFWLKNSDELIVE